MDTIDPDAAQPTTELVRPLSPAGWYKDGRRRRYWDGFEWQDHETGPAVRERVVTSRPIRTDQVAGDVGPANPWFRAIGAIGWGALVVGLMFQIGVLGVAGDTGPSSSLTLLAAASDLLVEVGLAFVVAWAIVGAVRWELRHGTRGRS